MMISFLLALALSQDAPPIQVPDGFSVQRVAGAPQIERPILASFDDRGRLYVADSAGVNLKGSELLKDPPHCIRVLEDRDGDGVFESSRVFADKLVFPQGLLWHQNAVYCISPPSFWKLEDTDGDGFCDKRTELLTGLANTGVADDAHGACLGPDGRIYFLPGRMAHNLKTPDGAFAHKATGPWLMRCRPDGREMEIVCGAQGNPVEVDWLPGGDFFISGTYWAPESYGGGLRDALVHGVEGGEYAVRDRVYGDRKRTGDFLPALVPMIATAPSGLMVARSPALGFEGQLLCSYFNTHKVQRHVLERDGAGFRAKTEEFVSSSSPDFHPTDVLEDADGSLLVLDTGGWFRIGCPTSQIAKPQVLGGIYRIRKTGMPAIADPRGLKETFEKPGALFDDPRFVVREKAIQAAAKGKAADLPLRSPSARVRLNCAWTLARMDEPSAVTELLRDEDVTVLQAALTVCGLRRIDDKVLRTKLLADTPQLRREAATALGRLGDRGASSLLLESMRMGADRVLEHALIFALIRLADRDACLEALKDPSPAVRRAALIALDQMEGGKLTPDLVTPLLDPVDAALQQAALKVVTSHGWTAELHGLVSKWLSESELDASRQDLLKGMLVSLGRDASMQDLMALALRADRVTAPMRLLILESMARVQPDRWPATWLAEARWSLNHPDERVVRQAVAVLRAAGAGDFDLALLAIARDDARSDELRVESCGAAISRLPKLESPIFRFLINQLDPRKAPLLRVSTAEVLGKAPLDDAQLAALAGALATAGPLEMPRVIAVFERSKNPAVGKKLLAALESAPGLLSLPGDVLRKVLSGYPEDLRRASEPLLKKLEVDTSQMKAKLEGMAELLQKGDARPGREVFYGRKAGCTACHTVQGQGGRVGPDLSKIGSIRSGRDLLEAIVFPSASFARGYEPFLIRTKDGGVHDGLISRETPDSIYLFTAERLEKRIARASIDVLQQSKLSIMPQGLDQQLSGDELRDLIAFLASLK